METDNDDDFDFVPVHPKQSTTSKIIAAITSTACLAEVSADFMYGAAGVTHSVAETIGRPLALGFENSIFSLLPYTSIGFAGVEILLHLDCIGSTWMNERRLLTWGNITHALIIALDCNVIAVAYANRAQLMSIGSTAFGLVCDAIALKALADFLLALSSYLTVRKAIQNTYPKSDFTLAYDTVSKETQNNFNQAEVALDLAAIRLIGWGALALAHLPALAAVAPALITLGSIFLIGEGLDFGYRRLCHSIEEGLESESESEEEEGSDLQKRTSHRRIAMN